MEVHTDRPGYLGDSACHTAYAKSVSTPEPLEISSMCSAPICSASAPIRASHHCRAYCGLAMGCSGVTACRAEGAMTPRPTVLPGAAGAIEQRSAILVKSMDDPPLLEAPSSPAVSTWPNERRGKTIV